MAYTNTTPTKANRGSFWAVLRTAYVAYIERQSRTDQIARLNRMTDEELTKLGVARDRIPQYVFRDLFHI